MLNNVLLERLSNLFSAQSYDEILHIINLPKLSQRMEQLCKEYFKLQNEFHKNRYHTT